MMISETDLNLTDCCLLILSFDKYVSLARHDVKL